MTDAQPSYTNWGKNEPNAAAQEEDYAMFSTEENNGTWSYDVEISELHHDDGELNHVSVSYEDGEESAQKVEFFVGEMVTEETSTPVVTPTPTPTPTPVPPASEPALTPIPIPVVEISTPEPAQTPDIGTPKPTPVPIPVIRSV